MRTPRSSRAFSITLVSSESSRFWTRVSPSASAASRSTRFEMLFEPGILTLPATRAIGSRSMNFTIRASSGRPRPGGVFPLLGQGGVARAARRGGRPSFSRRHHPAAFGGTPPRKRRGKSRRCAHKIQALRSFPVLQPAVARVACTGEKFLERLAVAALEHHLHALELPAVAPELDEQ